MKTKYREGQKLTIAIDGERKLALFKFEKLDKQLISSLISIANIYTSSVLDCNQLIWVEEEIEFSFQG